MKLLQFEYESKVNNSSELESVVVNDTSVLLCAWYVFSTGRNDIAVSFIINISSLNLRDCLGKGILSSWDEDCLHCKKSSRRITRGIFKEGEEDFFEKGWVAFSWARWRKRGRANVCTFWENRSRSLLAEFLVKTYFSCISKGGWEGCEWSGKV